MGPDVRALLVAQPRVVVDAFSPWITLVLGTLFATGGFGRATASWDGVVIGG
jgi:hypothetical protein